jgi:uncharacterized protein (TIGR03545 family)
MKIFRKGGLILFLILGLLTAAGLYFLTDEFIEEQLEKTLSVQNGALVEFDDFKIGFFAGTMAWQRLQVTNPENLMQNRFETGSTKLAIQAWKLLQKKVIIDEVTFADIKTGSNRTSSGELPPDWIPEQEPEDSSESALAKQAKERTKQAKQALVNEVKQQPLFQLANTSINADSLIAVLKLSSPQKIDSLKNAITTQINTVTTSVDNLKINQSVTEVEQKVKSIDIKTIKDVKAAEEALKSINELSKTANDLKKRVNTATTELDSGLKTVNAGTTQVDDWIEDDYRKAREAAKLPDFDSQKIGELLLGPELMNSVNEYLGYAETGRTYLAYFKSDEQAKEPEPERLKGQNIRYKQFEANPDFWIKKVNLNYTTDNKIALKGTISDIIDNQNLIGRPTILQLDGVNAANESMNINGEFNYIGDKPIEAFTFTMPKLSLRTLQLGGGGSLPNGFEQGNGSVTAKLTVTSGAPKARVEMENTGVRFKFDKKPSGKSEQTFRDIMGRINRFNVIANMESSAKGFKISIDSDIDNQVSRQIKAVANDEVNKVKKQIQAKVDAQVNAKKQELNKLISDQKQKLEAQKKDLEAKVNAQLAAIEAKKKELEAKKDEIIKQGANKAKDLLKSKIKL